MKNKSKDHKLNPVVGHIHLTVSDLERSLKFYRDILGFDISAKYGDSAIFLSPGGYHHHVGLNTWSGKNATRAPEGHTGMYHVAFLYPTRKELALVLKRLTESNYPISGTADHGVSEAIYLHDPDGNGVELYTDRPRSGWKRTKDGLLDMFTEPLDVKSLLDEIKN